MMLIETKWSCFGVNEAKGKSGKDWQGHANPKGIRCSEVVELENLYFK